METFGIRQHGRGLQLEGFPDAVKLIFLDDPKARRVAELLLHRRDLEFADQCLDAINLEPAEPSTIRSALWRCAVVHYAKCFGHSAARFQLNAEKIYCADPPEAKQVFEYFLNLRNRHVVHDENAFSQIIPAAVLNAGNKPYKIEKIVSLGMHVETLEHVGYANLKLLIQKALTWVVSEFDTCCELITKELEAIPYEDLLKRKEVVIRVPTAKDMSGNRRSKP